MLFLFLLVPWLVLFLFFYLMLTLFRAHSGYLHLLSALLRCSSSSLSRCWLEQTVLALCLRVVITGFLYTDVRRELSGCGITIVSRKEIDPSVLASSVVNCMCWSMLLICSRNLFPCRIYDHTSVIYISLQTSWGIFSCINGLGLKILPVEVGHNEGDGRCHSCSAKLFKEPALELEISGFQTKLP